MVVVAQHCPRTEVRWHGLATWADRCRATIAVDLEEMESPTSMVLSGQHRAGVPLAIRDAGFWTQEHKSRRDEGRATLGLEDGY
jgi:hypothetical protein